MVLLLELKGDCVPNLSGDVGGSEGKDTGSTNDYLVVSTGWHS
jgi:hypothetical protein